MKIMAIPDIHGRHEALQNSFDEFKLKGCDKVILLGDLADSFDRTNEDILRCFYMARDMQELLGDRMVWLLGNHDIGYIWSGNLCSGYREDLARLLNPWLDMNIDIFKIAHQEGNHLFTHAGIQRKWYEKHKTIIDKFEGNLGEQLNCVLKSCHRDILFEVGAKRGGYRYDYGGPVWCDRSEMESYGPMKGYHQIVGHTPGRFIERIEAFEGGKKYNNTSVTFTDTHSVKGPLIIEI